MCDGEETSPPRHRLGEATTQGDHLVRQAQAELMPTGLI